MPIWYANPDPMYQPAMRLVTNITNAHPVVVTTSFEHDYITGTIVRLYVPSYYGMHQINHQYGAIKVLSPTTFSVDIDTTTYDSFLTPAMPPRRHQTALCIPIGNLNNVYTAAVQNVLE